MLSWIPIIGPVIEGIVSIFNKKMDTDVVKYQTKVNAEVTDAQTAARIIEATKDDIGIRLTRDIVCFPVAIWAALISWDTIIAIRFPNLMFHVEKFPESVEYLPYAVLTFLLGNIGINAWKRK